MLVKFTILCLITFSSSLFALVDCNSAHNNPTVLLEMSTVLSGSVYPKGEKLNIRLYTDGKVEFDDYPPHPFEENPSHEITRLSSRIEPQEVKQIEEIISKMDFSEIKNKYFPTRLHNDSQMTKIITISYKGEDKVIQIEENDVVLKLGEKSPYPKSLIRLINTVDALNKKLRNLQ